VKIVLLGHDDAPSLLAVDRLLCELSEHRFEVFVSGPAALGVDAHPALRELAERDSRLAARILESAQPALKAREPLAAPNSADGLERLRAAAPELIVSIRYRCILREHTIAIPEHGVLNLHSGILPDYRGVMATFWAMLTGETEIGCT
jgi:methionyl-tRNA formyltransferase